MKFERHHGRQLLKKCIHVCLWVRENFHLGGNYTNMGMSLGTQSHHMNTVAFEILNFDSGHSRCSSLLSLRYLQWLVFHVSCTQNLNLWKFTERYRWIYPKVNLIWAALKSFLLDHSFSPKACQCQLLNWNVGKLCNFSTWLSLIWHPFTARWQSSRLELIEVWKFLNEQSFELVDLPRCSKCLAFVL